MTYDLLTAETQKKLRDISSMRGAGSRERRTKLYDHVTKNMTGEARRQCMRFLVKECQDLYFWFVWILRRRDGRSVVTFELEDVDKTIEVDVADWVYARCNDVGDRPDGYLDLWARGHYKSSIGTFAKSLMDVAIDRELTVGVFSFRSKAANDFITQFKVEMETNPLLPWLFPEVFWTNPNRDAPSWSVQSGLTVKRSTNPRAATFEGSGLEYGAPVGKHYALRVYDDIVTEDSITGDAPTRVVKAWELSLNLGQIGGRERYFGTRYAFNDAYGVMMSRGAVKPRIFPAETEAHWCDIDTKQDHVTREAYFMPIELLDAKRVGMGTYTYSCQMLLDPKGGSASAFNIQAIRRYNHVIPRPTVNIYMICDPAKGRTKRPGRSDYTCIQVWAAGADRNFYLVDMLHDRLGLEERANACFELYRRWKPTVFGYEEYGMMADIDHIQAEARRWTFQIPITPLGGKLAKKDRIERLLPLVEQGRIWVPERLPRQRKDENGMADMVHHLIEVEMANYPAIVHDDALDTMARLTDGAMNIVFPELLRPDAYATGAAPQFDSGSWMSG